MIPKTKNRGNRVCIDEQYRYRCKHCGSVTLNRRIRTNDYRCKSCGEIHTPSQRIDMYRPEDRK